MNRWGTCIETGERMDFGPSVLLELKGKGKRTGEEGV